MTEKIVILGGRGNGTVIASTIHDCKAAGQDVEIVGFLNDTEKNNVGDIPVLGNIKGGDWQELPNDYKFVYALATVGFAEERYQLLNELLIPGDRFATVVHPTAVVSNAATLGNGVVIMPHSVVGPDVEIGDHSQLYAQSFVGHDTEINEMVFVANNASVGGRVTVQKGVHVGSNASLIERMTVGKFAIVGLGAVVIDDVPCYKKVAGNPAVGIGLNN